MCREPNISSSSENVDENTAALTSHLEKTHEDNETLATELTTYIYNEIYKDAITCKKCECILPDGHGITLIKHLMESHHNDIPAKIRPKG